MAVLLAESAQAQWQRDGVPVCTASGAQSVPVEVPDGSGTGAIIVWQDGIAGVFHIYAQRLDPAGVPQWDGRGLLISNPLFSQTDPVAVADGVGGAIVAWREQHGADDYVWAQRINSAGTPVWWGGAGVALCQTNGPRLDLSIISDNRHAPLQGPGAIVAWLDQRSGNDIYAQAVDADGNVRWTPPTGVAVCTGTGASNPVMVTDGTGTISNPEGAIIAWEDSRNANPDIFAQRLNAAGAPQWGTNGAAVCTNTTAQSAPKLVFTGAGTAIVGWVDLRNANYDIYAQRIGAAGSWLTDGLPVCVDASKQAEVAMASDGAGGAVFSWQDYRAGSVPDIFAQRLSTSGSGLWTLDGIPVCSAPGGRNRNLMLADFAGGAIIVWTDGRSAAFDLYVQYVDGVGGLLWDPEGVPLCLAPEGQTDPAIIGDGAGGAIVAWADGRTGGYPDIYAQHVSAAGGVVAVAAARPGVFRVIDPFPNPTRGELTVRFELPAPRKISAQVLDIRGRVVTDLAAGREFPAGTATLTWNGFDAAHHRAPGGVYFVRVRAGSDARACKVLVVR